MQAFAGLHTAKNFTSAPRDPHEALGAPKTKGQVQESRAHCRSHSKGKNWRSIRILKLTIKLAQKIPKRISALRFDPTNNTTHTIPSRTKKKQQQTGDELLAEAEQAQSQSLY